jgi:hypothetical protein
VGSVPRINRPLAIVSWEILLLLWITFRRQYTRRLVNLFYWYNNQSKGVSILLYQLPYSLKPVQLYPLTSNSKAAWGLLVYLEIGSIFTAIPVSLSQSLRQLLHREIIHARHHLNAKVFRYLRTLIGKAAIKWGFLQNLVYVSQLSKSVNQPSLGR